MGFLDIFQFKNLSSENKSTLQKSIEKHFPGKEEVTYINYTCIAGLMARVAFADLKIQEGEEKFITDSLSQWTELTPEESLAITNIALENVKNLIGIENHFYCSPLVENFSEQERYDLVRCLFQLAASDGEVINTESEEIRQVNTALRLTHQHYISARAEVTEFLRVNKQ